MDWVFKKSENRMPDFMIAGEKVYLRPPHLSDWENWADVRRKNRMHLKPFEPTWPPNCLSEDFFKRRLARQTREWLGDSSYSFLILKTSDAKLIGGMNINNVVRGAAQFASLGYWIDKNHEGRGMMKESIRLTLQYCFRDLGLHRVHASCIPDNERSKNLLIKCGFKEEGYAENYLKIDGKWQDHILFGTCAENFHMLNDA